VNAPAWAAPLLTMISDLLAKTRRRMMPRRYAVLELCTAGWVAQAMLTFCELGLEAELAAGPATAAELSARGFGDPDRLFRLLRSLCAYDVVRYVGSGRFAAGSLAKAVAELRGFIRYANAPWHQRGHAALAQGVRSGRSGFESAHGATLFSYLAAHDAEHRVFDEAMEALAPVHAQPFALGYDFSQMQHVVDVGGGTGVLLTLVLQRFPHVRGTVFELEGVTVRTSDRLSHVAGSILTEPPPQADAYILSHVLHDWDDESCVRILQNVRAAMRQNARILVYELIAQPPNDRWSMDRVTDLEMLAILPGRERTLDEFNDLFERSGLRLNRIIRVAAPDVILELVSS
jgi:hypothetical protein